MTFDDIVSLINKGEKIYNLPLKVTFYARVSTDSDIQLNSLDNQLKYYEKYIKSNVKWIFIDGYIEEGVSGVSVNKRDSFKKMIKDASNHKFDLIITKEVSRFARDLEDSIHYIRLLKDCGVGVFFENQNLNTFDQNSELILNIMFNLAQDESKKLSGRIKFGHKMAMSKGHVLGSSNIIGYKKANCKLIIVDEEASFIKKVFNLYATGKYGFYKLGKKLSELGYLNKNNNIYDKDTLKRIIENPKYKGYYRAHTYEIMDYRTKRRKKIPESEQIIYKCLDNSVPAIVSDALWNKANEILKNRTESYKKNNNWSGGLKYPFSGKIFCSEHNVNFVRSHNKNPVWSCRLYFQYGISECISPIIKEEELYTIIDSIINDFISKENKIADELLCLYSNINGTKQLDKEIKNIDLSIKKIEEKKNLLIDLVYKEQFNKEWLKGQFEKIEKDIDCLLKNKKEILNQINNLKKYDSLDKLSATIKEEMNNGLSDEFIRKFIDKIIVSKINNSRQKIELDFFIDLSGILKSKNNFDRKNYVCLKKNQPAVLIHSKKILLFNIYIKSECFDKA